MFRNILIRSFRYGVALRNISYQTENSIQSAFNLKLYKIPEIKLDHAYSKFEIIDMDKIINSINSKFSIIDDSNENNNPLELKNDVQIKRRRMRKLRHKKMLKRNKNIFKKREMKANKIEKEKFDKYVTLMRQTAEGFDPRQKANRILTLARRGGFYVNILKSSDESK